MTIYNGHVRGNSSSKSSPLIFTPILNWWNISVDNTVDPWGIRFASMICFVQTREFECEYFVNLNNYVASGLHLPKQYIFPNESVAGQL
jgi:hypothetical protein